MFLISGGGAFASFFEPSLLTTAMVFSVLFASLYFYLKPLTEAVGFLMDVFQTENSQRKPKKWKLFHIVHKKNRYLRQIWPGLLFYLQSDSPPPPITGKKSQPLFSELVQQVVKRGKQCFPHLKFHVRVSSDMEVVVFAQSLYQVLWELVKNAAEAVPEIQPLSLNIHCFKDKDFFCVEVKDTGPGMDSQTLSQARLLYFSTKKQASGMGLNVVEQVLNRMGATLQMHSSKGQGLRVTLFIPLDYIDYVKGLDFHQSPPLNRDSKNEHQASV